VAQDRLEPAIAPLLLERYQSTDASKFSDTGWGGVGSRNFILYFLDPALPGGDLENGLLANPQFSIEKKWTNLLGTVPATGGASGDWRQGLFTKFRIP